MNRRASFVLGYALAAVCGVGGCAAGGGGDSTGTGGSASGGGSGGMSGGSGGADGTGGASSGGTSGGSGGAGTGTGGGVTPGSGGATPVDASGSGGASPTPDGGSPDGGPAGGAFRHPGAMLTAEQLAFLKMHISAGDAPWAGAFMQLQRSALSAASYVPTGGAPPGGIVTCGYISNPDIGCNYEKNVAAGAFENALTWALTGDKTHATGAVRILNAWTALMKGRGTPAAQEQQGNTGQDFNGILQSGWVGSTLARAAELIRSSDNGAAAGWAPADITKFQAMLRVAYVPYVEKGYIRPAATPADRLTGGNWDLSAIDGLIQIAVFLDDADLFNTALRLWRRRVPAYVYLTSDGAKPVTVPGDLLTWNGATTYVDGLCQETCRDLSHVQYGFAALINAAETALIQGVDLYGEQATRLIAGLEQNAKYWLGGQSLPAPCTMADGANFSANFIARPTWIVAYNAFANRLKKPLPSLKSVIGQNTAPTADDTHHIQWEALTYTDVGSVGIR